MTHTLKATLDQFFVDPNIRFASSHTLKAYKLDLNDFIKHILEERVNKVTEEGLFEEVANCTSVDLNSYKFYLGQSKAATIARKFASLRKFLNWAHKKELRRKALPEFPKLPTEQKLAPKWLTKSQVDALLRKAEKRDHCTCNRNIVMIKLMLHTGLRVSEVVALTWDEITIKRYDGIINVIGGKGKKDRIVPLNSTIRTVLSEYKEAMIKMGYEKDSYLFYGGRGKLKPDAVLRVFYSLNHELDFKATPHNLRHTFCKSLLFKGVPLNEISDLAGHSSLNITQRYITASLDDLTKSVEKLNEL